VNRIIKRGASILGSLVLLSVFLKSEDFYSSTNTNYFRYNFGSINVSPDIKDKIPSVKPVKADVRDSFAVGDFSKIKDYSFSYLNNLVVDAVNASVSSIDCVMYSINMKDVPDALIAARDRGVKIRVIIDNDHVYPKADTQIMKLINAGDGIEVRTLKGTRNYGVTHNKITIHDKSIVTTGSYNWTFQATFSNYENMIVLKDRKYVDGYIKYFEWMWSKARKISDGPSPILPDGYYGTPPQSTDYIYYNGYNFPLYLFSPGSQTENKIAEMIDKAKTSVDAVTFTFSSKPIADAIIRAYKRGVNVRFLEDIDMAKSSSMAKMLYEEGVPFKWMGGRDSKGAMHNKFIIIDSKILATGSFNFTTNASVNSFENVVLTDNSTVVNAYLTKFNWFYSQATSPQSSSEFDGASNSSSETKDYLGNISNFDSEKEID
jgi:phosphatidylserine/phosphatidylglycerophosphate/cardiolipin synthase-like enzyme